jgi:hypothetical protein
MSAELPGVTTHWVMGSSFEWAQARASAQGTYPSPQILNPSVVRHPREAPLATLGLERRSRPTHEVKKLLRAIPRTASCRRRPSPTPCHDLLQDCATSWVARFRSRAYPDARASAHGSTGMKTQTHFLLSTLGLGLLLFGFAAPSNAAAGVDLNLRAMGSGDGWKCDDNGYRCDSCHPLTPSGSYRCAFPWHLCHCVDALPSENCNFQPEAMVCGARYFFSDNNCNTQTTSDGCPPKDHCMGAGNCPN